MKKQRLFLIGGMDLEMQTITSLLRKQGIPYRDASLHWNNALLSHYQQEVQTYGEQPEWELYGIELREDIPAPSNYTRIDHHNDYAHRPSSLEQVATLLHIPMDRHLQLVAANDSGYIPALQAMGATSDEIRRIRLADRKAQGITPEDEILAEASIAQGMTHEGNLLLIEAQTSCFAPICDRLYPYKRLLIHNHHEIAYYGAGINVLSNYFAKAIQAGHMYHGGGSNGYFGTAADYYSPEELKAIIQLIQKLTTS